MCLSKQMQNLTRPVVSCKNGFCCFAETYTEERAPKGYSTGENSAASCILLPKGNGTGSCQDVQIEESKTVNSGSADNLITMAPRGPTPLQQQRLSADQSWEKKKVKTLLTQEDFQSSSPLKIQVSEKDVLKTPLKRVPMKPKHPDTSMKSAQFKNQGSEHSSEEVKENTPLSYTNTRNNQRISVSGLLVPFSKDRPRWVTYPSSTPPVPINPCGLQDHKCEDVKEANFFPPTASSSLPTDGG
ncbi:hypothetical protein MG293_014793 [Ovis ammon polii]|uniref:Uncharacterized protein n=1 Tax=Ovis ammon polii TaxID=230172 RepID=A0AAD4TZJ4_OVIAM|nr:hypothetical protein MG293_014793 [Ovis ammon polii]